MSEKEKKERGKKERGKSEKSVGCRENQGRFNLEI